MLNLRTGFASAILALSSIGHANATTIDATTYVNAEVQTGYFGGGQTQSAQVCGTLPVSCDASYNYPATNIVPAGSASGSVQILGNNGDPAISVTANVTNSNVNAFGQLNYYMQIVPLLASGPAPGSSQTVNFSGQIILGPSMSGGSPDVSAAAQVTLLDPLLNTTLFTTSAAGQFSYSGKFAVGELYEVTMAANVDDFDAKGTFASSAAVDPMFTLTGPDASQLEIIFSPGIADAVPEPSTWAMMMLGFCGLGFMAYRKKPALRFAS